MPLRLLFMEHVQMQGLFWLRHVPEFQGRYRLTIQPISLPIFATQEVKLNNLYQQGLTVNQAYKNFGLTAPQGEGWSDEELEW